MQMKQTYIYGADHYGVLTAFDCEQKGVEIAGFMPVYEPDKILSLKREGKLWH